MLCFVMETIFSYYDCFKTLPIPPSPCRRCSRTLTSTCRSGGAGSAGTGSSGCGTTYSTTSAPTTSPSSPIAGSTSMATKGAAFQQPMRAQQLRQLRCRDRCRSCCLFRTVVVRRRRMAAQLRQLSKRKNSAVKSVACWSPLTRRRFAATFRSFTT